MSSLDRLFSRQSNPNTGLRAGSWTEIPRGFAVLVRVVLPVQPFSKSVENRNRYVCPPWLLQPPRAVGARTRRRGLAGLAGLKHVFLFVFNMLNQSSYPIFTIGLPGLSQTGRKAKKQVPINGGSGRAIARKDPAC